MRRIASLSAQSESPSGDRAVAAKGAWYVDPFGAAGERWWDGHKWTREVRGAPAASSPPKPSPSELAPGPDQKTAVGKRTQIMTPGWYPWDAGTVLYWDGSAWQQTRIRTAGQGRTEATAPRWMVRAGYFAAVLMPILGLILGMMLAVRPHKGARAQGIEIIMVSVLVFALALLLSHH